MEMRSRHHDDCRLDRSRYSELTRSRIFFSARVSELNPHRAAQPDRKRVERGRNGHRPRHLRRRRSRHDERRREEDGGGQMPRRHHGLAALIVLIVLIALAGFADFELVFTHSLMMAT